MKYENVRNEEAKINSDEWIAGNPLKNVFTVSVWAKILKEDCWLDWQKKMKHRVTIVMGIPEYNVWSWIEKIKRLQELPLIFLFLYLRAKLIPISICYKTLMLCLMLKLRKENKMVVFFEMEHSTWLLCRNNELTRMVDDIFFRRLRTSNVFYQFLQEGK